MSPLVNRSGTRLGILGNPKNRRVTDFTQAWLQLGQPAPVCLAYEDLLKDAPLPADLEQLRIDSPGENEAVARALIALGGGPPGVQLAFGEIAFLREYHRGFCKLLERIAVPCLNAPGDIAVMFDKWASHQRFAQRGLARPPAELAPDDFDALWQEMRARRSGRLFLKPMHGSSASGVCALRWTPHRQELFAPLRIEGKTLVNSLEVRRYTAPADLETILGQLLPQGAVDLRVLVIAGEARHRVVRQSEQPMTNLHLGNRRGDEAELKDHIGASGFEAALRLAEEAAACFPRSLYAGVDILLDSAGRPLVGEINAFGDLLPRLFDRGESAYTAIARACAQSCFV